MLELGDNRIKEVGKLCAIAVGKKHPKDYNFKSFTGFYREGASDGYSADASVLEDKEELNGIEKSFQGDPSLLEWCTNEQERDSWQLFVQTVQLNETQVGSLTQFLAFIFVNKCKICLECKKCHN